ncbi:MULTISPECIES: carbohydrate porin [unclassified Synechococcus]|uniref:carbohydrate porin n=1 Tax=unclassified Synechococcus TaxID=2626047 RepID=UPI0021A2AD66|nr:MULTISPECIES: carbohydrate porin [unclassified Synechococcus]MCT0214291.1 carbohydrate porin [Synechococcus sp. CS-1326]MCT0234455.1 carbohydrate porin [Synechococcus sp. CS-1327]
MAFALAMAVATDVQPLRAQEPEDFTPTTIIHAQVNTAMGALSFEGDVVDRGSNTALGFPLLNALSVNHDARVTIDTSFTGQDLLRVRFRSGNFGASGFFSNPPTPLTRLDFASDNPISVNRAYLQVPLSPELRISVGGIISQLDMLPVWPSVYNDSPILDLFQYAGAPGAYSKRSGGGFGAWWQPRGVLQGFSLGYAYVAERAGGSPQGGGLFSPVSSQTSTLQLALTRPQWNITGAYTFSGPQVRLRGTPLASLLAAGARDGSLQSWSVAGYWQPRRSRWIPSISVGLGQDSFRFGAYPVANVSGLRTQSWYTGLVWSDVLRQGNSLGFAVGSPAHVTAIQASGTRPIDDRSLAYELYYRIVVSDELSLTPAVFWLTRPRGAMTASDDPSQALLLFPVGSTDATLGVWAGLIRATLRF